MEIFHVDAFTDRKFSGNPAGVCVLPRAATEQWMQDVAREVSHPETAFLVRDGAGFGLRWFTPTVEVELCGHATLASAHVLWEQGVVEPAEAIRFQTKSGVLKARRTGGWIELEFPALPAKQVKAPPGLEKAIGAKARYVGKSRFDYLCEVDSEETVRGLEPDPRLVAALPMRGVIVTAKSSTKGFDFVSRFFAPKVGIDEDPVTGTAHCVVAPFWGARLAKKEMTGYQASSRGGTVRVGLGGSKVLLGGKAVTVMRSELLGEG